MSNWTQERVDQLKALYLQGLSYSLIAAAMGGVTREAISGKIDRLGINKTFPARSAVAHIRRPRPDRPLPPPAPIPENVPAPLNLTIEALSDSACRWPIGFAAPYAFCGHPVRDGAVYCSGHCRIAFSPKYPATQRQEAQ